MSVQAHANGKIPLFLEQWFHAANMAVVLAVMVGYAAYLGWKVRSGDREASTLGPGDDTAGTVLVACASCCSSTAARCCR